MKRKIRRLEYSISRVAPLAGAWIETNSAFWLTLGVAVAPLAGAWIETDYEAEGVGKQQSSHPSRVRGLKLYCPQIVNTVRQVAPLAGAWIETGDRLLLMTSTLSHPSRVRGLKLVVKPCSLLRPCLSHPSRVRGLKQHISLYGLWRTMSHPSRVRGLKH